MKRHTIYTVTTKPEGNVLESFGTLEMAKELVQSSIAYGPDETITYTEIILNPVKTIWETNDGFYRITKNELTI